MDKPPLAVMGTIPIYWGEAADLGELVAGAVPPHWARARLERSYRLIPLDYLSSQALEGRSRLLLAQPRGLSPEENVALDDWVRGGGRLLLFADPMMTGASRFAIGDRRRPQDVTVLSPILDHWGLQMRFDPAQGDDLQMRHIAGAEVPVMLAGEIAPGPDGASCSLDGAAVWALCRLGAGQVAILADAALLDVAGPWAGAPEALDRLVGAALEEIGEFAGDGAYECAGERQTGENPPVSARIAPGSEAPP